MTAKKFSSISATLSCLRLFFFGIPRSFLFQLNDRVFYVQSIPLSRWLFFNHFAFQYTLQKTIMPKNMPNPDYVIMFPDGR